MQWESFKDDFLAWAFENAAVIHSQKKMPTTWEPLFRLWLDHIR